MQEAVRSSRWNEGKEREGVFNIDEAYFKDEEKKEV